MTSHILAMRIKFISLSTIIRCVCQIGDVCVNERLRYRGICRNCGSVVVLLDTPARIFRPLAGIVGVKIQQIFDVVLEREDLVVDILGTLSLLWVYVQQINYGLPEEWRIVLFCLNLTDQHIQLLGIESAFYEIVQR